MLYHVVNMLCNMLYKKVIHSMLYDLAVYRDHDHHDDSHGALSYIADDENMLAWFVYIKVAYHDNVLYITLS
jgi:hypothetical protein